MEMDPDQNQPASCPSSSPSTGNEELPVAVSTFGTTPFHQHTNISYHSYFPTSFNEPSASATVQNDIWSSIIVILTFWFFVSMSMILGVYGSSRLWLGESSSILIRPNPLFVEYVRVEQTDNADSGPRLYGFYEDPALDVVTSWSETQTIYLPAGTHKEWIYFLNKGSQINISYMVNSESLCPLVLVIAQGNDGFAQWLEDPSYPNTTLSWNIIHGSGMIQQDISKFSSYYVAVGNLNSELVEVQLNLGIKALLYNTSEAYYKCTSAHGWCSLRMLFPKGSTALLTSPSILPVGTVDKGWHVTLSYGPRWIAYLFGIGIMTVVMLVAFRLTNNYRYPHEDRTRDLSGGMGSQTAPLLSQRDNNISRLKKQLAHAQFVVEV